MALKNTLYIKTGNKINYQRLGWKKIFAKKFENSFKKLTLLTLIWAAGGIYDFKNFEQV